MAIAGDIVSGITSVLSHPFATGKIEERIKYRNVLYNLLSHDVKSIGGQRDAFQDYVKLGRYATARQNVAGGRTEGQDVRLPGTTTYAYPTLYPKMIMGSIGWSWERLQACQSESAFQNVIVNDFAAHIDGVRAMQDALWFMDGTGRVGRVASYNSTTRVVTLDNDQPDFGVNGCDLMKEGGLYSIYTVADIVGTSAWTTKATDVVVDQVSKSGKTFRITARTDSAGNAISGSEIAVAPADSDYVFVAGAVVLDSDNKWSAWALPMGIHGIVDDGQDSGAEFTESGNLYNHSWYGVTVQGLDRTAAANSMFKARVSRGGDRNSGTDGTVQTTDMNDIDGELDYLFQINDGPDPSRLISLCNSKTRRWWAATAKNEQNGFQTINDGRVVAGLVLSGFRSEAAGGQVIPVFTIPTMSDGTIIFLDTARLAFWDEHPLGPFAYGGKTQFESPGTRNLQFERWSMYYGNLGFERADTSLRIEDIDIS